MDIKTYALRCFGIEINEPSLTNEEKELLEEIRIYQETEIHKDYGFIVDEEFSELCSSYIM